ncbi:MAG: VF530 family protein [Mariprofundaceae bacterium]
MSEEQPDNPLHGVKLEHIVTKLEAYYGWDALADQVNINCFKMNPSVKSSLKFLRKTPWAREKVEKIYIATFSAKNPWNK